MSFDGSEDFQVYPFHYLNDVADAYGVLDIGGTNGSTAWADVADFDRIYGFVEIGGTWNASDDLDGCKLEQATSSTGTGKKDLTTSGSGTTYNYDASGYPADAAGDIVVLTARAEDLDSNNGFHFVRLYVEEGGNTGVDQVLGFLMLHNKAHKKAQVQGATAAAEDAIHYVSPHSAGGL